MNCSICGGKMIPGEAALRYTRWGFLFYGLSYKKLYFKAQGAGPNEKTVALSNNRVSSAYKCSKCSAVTVLPDGEKRNLFHW